MYHTAIDRLSLALRFTQKNAPIWCLFCSRVIYHRRVKLINGAACASWGVSEEKRVGVEGCTKNRYKNFGAEHGCGCEFGVVGGLGTIEERKEFRSSSFSPS